MRLGDPAPLLETNSCTASLLVGPIFKFPRISMENKVELRWRVLEEKSRIM